MWLLTIKPSFLNELVALQPKEAAQIQKKLVLLTEDPAPDAKVKKQLKHLDGKLHRLRAGDFRIFYTFAEPYVSVLALRRRDEHTYDDDVESEMLGGAAAGEIPETGRDPWNQWLKADKAGGAALPRAITVELLEALAIPEQHHDALLAIRTEDELLGFDRLPDPLLEKLIDGVVGRPIEQVNAQPDLLVASTEDLLRYREGQLVAFLLRLDPEQEKFVGWARRQGSDTAQGRTRHRKEHRRALSRARDDRGAAQGRRRAAPHLVHDLHERARSVLGAASSGAARRGCGARRGPHG
jgi:mRNA-degrading endonuclease RelE of RelBE toxin-antitoxin system